MQIFFTGFPGFIGKRLVRKILQAEPEASFHFLIQENMRATAKAVTNQLKHEFPKASFQIYAGDITHEKLGLSEKDYEYLSSETTDIFHLAAIYDLSTPKSVAYKVNVEGTKNILNFARQCPKLRKLVYFSTCYVAGKRTGLVLEDELEQGQDFKNHYESTKYLAEVEVRKAMKELPIIVIRPAIVVGDSQTGETQKFDGPYFIMKYLDTLYFGMPLPYIGESPAPFNIVPVDFVEDASVALWRKEDNNGTTYALSDPKPLKAREVTALFSEEILNTLPNWEVPHWLLEGALSIAPVRKTLGIPLECLNYLHHSVQYDCRNTLRDLEGTGVRCPSLTSYYKPLVRFYLQHKNEKQYQVPIH